MALPTFTWIPSYELSLGVAPNVQRTPLGDGYVDHVPIGARPNRRRWRLRFDTRFLDETLAIMAFLDDRGAHRRFRWTPPAPDENPGVWVAEQWRVRRANGVIYGVETEFIEQ